MHVSFGNSLLSNQLFPLCYCVSRSGHMKCGTYTPNTVSGSLEEAKFWFFSDKLCINELVCCNCLSNCRDKTVVNRYLLSVLVRLFLEKHEQLILKFVTDFSRLTVSDEKVNSFWWLLVLYLVACCKMMLISTVSALLCIVWQIVVLFQETH